MIFNTVILGRFLQFLIALKTGSVIYDLPILLARVFSITFQPVPRYYL